MTGHPLVLAIWLMDGISGALFLAAGWRLLTILPHWRPAASDAAQLARERSLALVVYQGRWLIGLQAVALVVLVAGISNGWVAHVPGAMCGTGVLQALGPAGRQALLLRLAALLLLYCWQAVTGIDARRPDMPLALTHGRLLLLAIPLFLLATGRFSQAVSTVVGQGPVSCCAVLYAQAASAAGHAGAGAIAPRIWAVAGFSGAALIGAWGLWQWRRPRRIAPWVAGLAGGVILAWIGTAVMAIKTFTAPYLLEVLSHPCPWCLFLWEHGGLGFVLFGLTALMAAEGAVGLTAVRIARGHPALQAPALARVARSGARLGLAALFFVILAAAPLLLWRLRSGGWITI